MKRIKNIMVSLWCLWNCLILWVESKIFSNVGSDEFVIWLLNKDYNRIVKVRFACLKLWNETGIDDFKRLMDIFDETIREINQDLFIIGTY